MKSLKIIFIFILSIATILGCRHNALNNKTEYFSIKGETMGTYYSIKYSDDHKRNLKPQIDSILFDINQSLSTYIPDSYISRINSAPDIIVNMSADQHFIKNYTVAKKVFENTNGLYDPTVGAMTNYYGFGKDRRVMRENIPSNTLDSLNTLVGMNRFHLQTLANASQISKAHVNMQIDFSSIAKGYAVDEISNYLLSNGCNNHLVDIGGDGLSKGLSPSNKDWTIGINNPVENSSINEFALVISISDKGLATSGNYRNFYIAGEKKYGHTINPKSGLPEITTLLSTSVIADNCMISDAYATACMVMGLTQSQDLIAKLPGIEACWIHDADQDGELDMTMSDGFEVFLATQH